MEAPQAQGAPQGGAAQVVEQVYSGLMKLAQAAANAQGAPDGVADRLAAMADEFKDIISGGGGEQEAPANAPMEAGASGAKPAL